LQVEGGVEQFQLALPVGHVHAESGLGWAEAHAVFQVPWQKGGNVKGFGHGDMLKTIALCREHVVIAFAPRRVGDFAQDGSQFSVRLVAVKEAHRVERQPPAAGLGQQADRALGRMP